MSNDQPANKGMQTVVKPVAAGGGNNQPDTPSTPGGGNIANPFLPDLASNPMLQDAAAQAVLRPSATHRQHSIVVSSEANDQNVTDDPVVMSAGFEDASQSAADSHKKKSKTSKPKAASGASSSRKRDHDSMANAYAPAVDTAAHMAAQPSSAAFQQQPKYQRILPAGPSQEKLREVEKVAEMDAAQRSAHNPFQLRQQFLESEARAVLPMAQICMARVQQDRTIDPPGNTAMPSQPQGNSQPIPGPTNVQVDVPANDPGNNPANVQLDQNHAPFTTIMNSFSGSRVTSANDWGEQANVLMNMSCRNEQFRQAQSQGLRDLLSSQIQAQTRHIEACGQAFRDLQAAHARADAAREWETKAIHSVMAKRNEFIGKVEDSLEGLLKELDEVQERLRKDYCG